MKSIGVKVTDDDLMSSKSTTYQRSKPKMQTLDNYGLEASEKGLTQTLHVCGNSHQGGSTSALVSG